jgi:hypothetical protein
MASGISTGPLARAFGVLACSSALTIGLTVAAVGAEVSVFETIPPGEAEQIDETAAIMMHLQDLRQKNDPSQHGQLLRGVHPKSHGCVKAEFAVNSDIAEEYRVGLFADPGRKFDAWIRYSNAAALREDDLKPGSDGKRGNGSRGMALKILDVDGEMIDLDNGEHNQDFLMINTPEFAFPDTRNYLRLNRVLERSDKGHDPGPFFTIPGNPPLPAADDSFWGDTWADFQPASDGLATKNSGRVIGEIKKQTVQNPIEIQYFGAAPFMFGPDRVMKFSVAACHEIEQPSLDELLAKYPSENYLREAVTATMKGEENICLNFKLQVRADGPDLDLIENASSTWKDELVGYKDVARITIPAPQEPDTQESIDHCEKLAFTPWHSLQAHRPIGGINRLRQEVYYSSAKHRGALPN